MAEIVGVVSGAAGLVSVAIQLAECALKLKSFYERARDIRTSLTDLTHDLETISLTLRELERHRRSEPYNTALLERCAIRCEEKANKIALLVEKLDSRIKKFNMTGRAYAALKQPEIPKILDELEQAKSSIMIALQMYSLSKQSSQDKEQSIQIERLREENSAVQAAILHQVKLLTLTPASVRDVASIQNNTTRFQPILNAPIEAQDVQNEVEHDIASRSRHYRMIRRRQKYGKPFKMRVSFASSVIGRIWDIAFSRSQTGVSWTLTTWNVIPSSSPIFRACWSEDMYAIRERIFNGSASLLDVDEDGRTLLGYAALYARLDVCRFLLDETAFSDNTEVLANALDLYTLYRMAYPPHNDVEDQIYRLFIEEFNMNVEFDDISTRLFVSGCPNAGCAAIITRNQALPYKSRSQDRRFDDALNLQGLIPPETAEVMLQWSGESRVTHELATFQASNGYTALHLASLAIGMHLTRFCARQGSPAASKSWLDFLVNLITMGADLFALRRGMTPLLTGLTYCLSFKRDVPTKIVAETALEFLNCWTTTLREAGIDVMAYGNKETHMWPQSHPIGVEFFPVHLIFGDQPETWNLETVQVIDIPIFELQPIPGSWDRVSTRIKQIWWQLGWIERDEGPWTQVHKIQLQSRPVDLRSCVEQFESEAFREILRQAQDDHGPIVLRASSRYSRAHSYQRSSSQPPPTARRNSAYWESVGERNRPWMRCHLCPLDNKWRLTCLDIPKLWRGGIFDLRDCLAGHPASRTCLQDTDRWNDCNFLSKHQRDE